MWTNNLTYHLMVELDTTVALILYIVEMNLYELHPMKGQVFNDFFNDK